MSRPGGSYAPGILYINGIISSVTLTLKNRVLITFSVPVLNVYVTQLNTVLLVCNYKFFLAISLHLMDLQSLFTFSLHHSEFSVL